MSSPRFDAETYRVITTRQGLSLPETLILLVELQRAEHSCAQ